VSLHRVAISEILFEIPYFAGRWELRTFLIVYLLTLPLQIITNTSLLPQGSMSLVVFTAIHAGLVVSLFWILIANAIVATQLIEDGTMASIAVRHALWFS